MPSPAYTIESLPPPEVSLAVAWAAREGWNPGRHDAACYAAADPSGFLVGRLGDEPVATISVVRYDETFCFLGFYIVAPRHRGRGYGLKIWNAGLAAAGGRTVGLDGVAEQQANYRASGFVLAYRNVRFEGRGFENAGSGKASGDAAHHDGDDGRMVPLDTLPFATVDAYDRPFFPAARPAFTRAWIAQPDSRALGLVGGGALRGYGVIRRCQTGHKIAPLFADTPSAADTLFRALASTAGEGEPVFLDVPEVNPAGLALAERYGMTVTFETARMYRGPAPNLPLDRTFGVASFEIG